MEDRMILCRTCGKQFTFSAREQEFFASKNFDPPRRCPECRIQRKRENDSGEGSPTRPGGQQGHREENRSWTEVICASCGKPTQVPFRPTSGRPVYCRECFAEQGRTGAATGTPARKPPVMDGSLPSVKVDSTAPPRSPISSTPIPLPSPDWVDDPGPLPEVEPAPDEEGEITVADYMPIPMGFGSTAEEPNPSFEDNDQSERNRSVEPKHETE